MTRWMQKVHFLLLSIQNCSKLERKSILYLNTHCICKTLLFNKSNVCCFSLEKKYFVLTQRLHLKIL